ncbi:hypothetical protein DOTSEDRAFT_73884 [Dothistroma septosporum NZE10]|uniref:Uncharacterized protein n=1 Tax=Dothistroma septosporum (strain NZE10 / CBS 128990) TaxID=675120 RepID=N1PGW8_DOTSN|nr:hypothetical protein DOTSEDRAFT_73884 [Dothistroma septosporum NZE10]
MHIQLPQDGPGVMQMQRKGPIWVRDPFGSRRTYGTGQYAWAGLHPLPEVFPRNRVNHRTLDPWICVVIKAQSLPPGAG